ncbi:methyltransferase domain-containing protein [Candidatus Bathyarchaeota archaeon]|nr:methyltransferase domain-containing protein [Candidatus Bathyarchaeota archaeon]
MPLASLDVGCGIKMHGAPNTDVNCGLGKQKFWNNFIRCDARYLPFRNKIFKVVYCHHVLEHIQDYKKALLELVRVTDGLIEIKLPHVLSKIRRYKGHKHSFNLKGVKKLFKNFKCYITVNYRGLNRFPPLVLPYEMVVKIRT